MTTGDCFTFATVKTDPVRYAVVFATAGCHDPSFKRSTQASTWLMGFLTGSRQPTGPDPSRHDGQRVFPAPKVISGFTSCVEVFF